jgi:hypothetical protein
MITHYQTIGIVDG